jgi:hypothetical protein
VFGKTDGTPGQLALEEEGIKDIFGLINLDAPTINKLQYSNSNNNNAITNVRTGDKMLLKCFLSYTGVWHNSLNGLSMNQVFVIGKQQLINFHETDYVTILPMINVDASWAVISKTNISSHNKVNCLMHIELIFCNAGFNVVLVCDSDSGHHSKKATIKRVADSYNDRISRTCFDTTVLLPVKKEIIQRVPVLNTGTDYRYASSGDCLLGTWHLYCAHGSTPESGVLY